MNFSDIKQSFYKQVIPVSVYPFMSRSYSPTLSVSRQPMYRNEKKRSLATNTTTNTTRTTYVSPTANPQTVLQFEKIKLVTFYTANDDIGPIIMKEDINFQLNYRGHKFNGTSSTLQNFSNKKECQRHSCEVLLFDEKFQYCNLQVNVGIVCDGRVDTSTLQLSKSKRGNIYFSSHTKACSPLPEEWIEVISEGVTPQMLEEMSSSTLQKSKSQELPSSQEWLRTSTAQKMGSLPRHSRITEGDQDEEPL